MTPVQSWEVGQMPGGHHCPDRGQPRGLCVQAAGRAQGSQPGDAKHRALAPCRLPPGQTGPRVRALPGPPARPAVPQRWLLGMDGAAFG